MDVGNGKVILDRRVIPRPALFHYATGRVKCGGEFVLSRAMNKHICQRCHLEISVEQAKG